MKTIKTFRNITVEEIIKFKINLGIFACGYENRCTQILNLNLPMDNKVAFAFKDTSGFNFEKNLKEFKNNSVEIVSLGHKSFDRILNFLKKKLEFIEEGLGIEDPLNLVIDYSSMTRYWYGAMVNFFKYYGDRQINIFLLYSEANYSLPKKYKEEIEIESMDFLSHIAYPEKPVALIVCLGDHVIQAAGLKEYYDAQELYYFYLKNENSEIILNNNEDIISKTTKIFPFKNDDLVLTKYVLDKLCERLSNKYRVIIAPCGPKTFTLISILSSSFSNHSDVWRIGFKRDKNFNREAKPNGKIIGNWMTLI